MRSHDDVTVMKEEALEFPSKGSFFERKEGDLQDESDSKMESNLFAVVSPSSSSSFSLLVQTNGKEILSNGKLKQRR